MAKLIQNKCDVFQADAVDASISGSSLPPAEPELIQVPHHIGQLIVNMREAANKNGYAFNAVRWIKFLRQWYSETTGKSLGLKDAKDIVDHYMSMANVSLHDRPIHLQHC